LAIPHTVAIFSILNIFICVYPGPG